jgi:hypothetical protein
VAWVEIQASEVRAEAEVLVWAWASETACEVVQGVEPALGVDAVEAPAEALAFVVPALAAQASARACVPAYEAALAEPAFAWLVVG